MTELLSSQDIRGDAELIALVRGGDNDAFGELYARHVEAARRLARQLLRGSDADDLVSEAFTKVMTLLQAGHGPDVAFRAYLLTAIRRLHVDRVRGEARLTTSDDMTAFDPGIPFHDTAVDQFESSAAARAFASLPERWQLVLWHLEVEGQKPADIAPLLGMSPNSVSALAYRAREGLRQAFLSAHLRETEASTCRWVTEHLGSYVRKGLSRRDNSKIDAHLRECRSCSAMYLELAEVNSNLRAIIAPMLLGSLAAGYLSSAGGTGAGGLTLLWDRAKDAVGANSGTTVVGGAAAATVVAVAIAATLLGPAERAEVADQAEPDPTTSQPQPGSALPEQRRVRRADARRASDAPGLGAVLSPALPALLPPAEGAVPETPSATEEPFLAPDAVVDPAGPVASAPGVVGAAMTISAASMDDEALRLVLAGVPDDAVEVVVRMTSASGTVTFAEPGGDCAVTSTTARCPVGVATAAQVGAPGKASLVRTVEGLQSLTIPIRFPASLVEDTVTVGVALPGAGQQEVLDSLTFTFRPTRTGGGTTPTATTTAAEPTATTTAAEPTATTTAAEPTATTTAAEPTATTTAAEPTATTTATATSPAQDGHDISLRLSVQPGVATVRLTAEGLPVGEHRRDLVIDVSQVGGPVGLGPRPAECRFEGSERIVCSDTGRVRHVDLVLDVTRLAPGTSAALSFTASLAGDSDPDTSDNTASMSVTAGGDVTLAGALGLGRAVVEAASTVSRTVAAADSPAPTRRSSPDATDAPGHDAGARPSGSPASHTGAATATVPGPVPTSPSARVVAAPRARLADPARSVGDRRDRGDRRQAGRPPRPEDSAPPATPSAPGASTQRPDREHEGSAILPADQPQGADDGVQASDARDAEDSDSPGGPERDGRRAERGRPDEAHPAQQGAKDTSHPRSTGRDGRGGRGKGHGTGHGNGHGAR